MCRLPAFSHASDTLLVFTSSSHWLLVIFSFWWITVVIDLVLVVQHSIEKVLLGSRRSLEDLWYLHQFEKYLLLNSGWKLGTLCLQECHKCGIHISYSFRVHLPLLSQAFVYKVTSCVSSDSQFVRVKRLDVKVADITMNLLPGRGMASITELVI